MKTPTVPASLFRSMFQAAEVQQVSWQSVLEDCGLSAALLQDGDRRIPHGDFVRTMTRLWDVLHDESSGFTTPPMRPGTFTLLCHSTITCPNLRRALLRGGRFVSLLNTDVSVELQEYGEEAHLIVHHENRLGADNRFFIESLFVIWVRWASWMIDQRILLDRSFFTYTPPAYVEDYPNIFPCRHYFRQSDNRVVFSRRYLEQPVVQNPYTLSTFLAQAPGCLLVQYRSETSMTSQIRQALQQQVEQVNNCEGMEQIGLDHIAGTLNMSAQTLRRRLREEGNSYQEIKDSIRRDLAIYHLRNQEPAIHDIALLLGFSEPSAFNRAFKRWTGLTPGVYRKQASDQQAQNYQN